MSSAEKKKSAKHLLKQLFYQKKIRDTVGTSTSLGPLALILARPVLGDNLRDLAIHQGSRAQLPGLIKEDTGPQRLTNSLKAKGVSGWIKTRGIPLISLVVTEGFLLCLILWKEKS